MAEKNIDVAQESSVQEVNEKIGSTGDTGGSTTAGSLFAKLNAILTNWTSTRAGYIDTIKTNTDRMTSARATKIDNIGAAGDTGGSATAGTVMAKLNALLTSWTSTRAGYVDNIRSYTLTNNTASKTGVLSQKLAYVIGLLENSSYGLAAIDKHYELSDNVLSTLISSETYTDALDTDISPASAFMYCGSFTPKHSGFVKIKLSWKPTGTTGNISYGGKSVHVLVSDGDMTPTASNVSDISMAAPISNVRKACQSLSVGALGQSSSSVRIDILERICPYVYSKTAADREDEIVVPVTKGKTIYILGEVQWLSSGSEWVGGPRIYSLTVCGKEVNN